MPANTPTITAPTAQGSSPPPQGAPAPQDAPTALGSQPPPVPRGSKPPQGAPSPQPSQGSQGARPLVRPLVRPRGLFLLGLTGAIASGKSNISSWLRARGLPIVDADAVVARLRAESALEPWLRTCGLLSAPLAEEPTARRAALRDIARTPEGLDALERFFHPRVRREVQRFVFAARRRGHHIAVLEIPLLLERNYLRDTDFVINTIASDAQTTHRLIQRAKSAGQDASRARLERLQKSLLAAQASVSARKRALAHHPGILLPTGLSRADTRRLLRTRVIAATATTATTARLSTRMQCVGAGGGVRFAHTQIAPRTTTPHSTTARITSRKQTAPTPHPKTNPISHTSRI